MEGKRTPLWEGIPSKTQKGNSPIIRGIHLPKEVEVIHCWGHQKKLTGDTGKQLGRPKAKQEVMQPCQLSSWLSFPYRSLYILNILLIRKKRLHGGEDIGRELGGV
jgi:hypothetical protein